MSENAPRVNTRNNRIFGAAIGQVKGQEGIEDTKMVSFGPSKTRRQINQRAAPFKPVTVSQPVELHERVGASSFGMGSPKLMSERMVSEKWRHDRYEGGGSGAAGSEVFVRNLPEQITQMHIQRLFKRAGDVIAVKVDNGPLSTAKVSFLKKNQAQDAVRMLHGHKLMGHAIKVALIE
eukprot:Platyproteum_vivax@DN4032_c0_g1_i1.p1